MNQGDIFLANLNPTEGSEQSGVRPVIILSGNTLNTNLDICIVCPMTSILKKFPGCQIISASEINDLSRDSQILTFQIRTISQSRLIKKLGHAEPALISKLKKGLWDILDL